MKFAPVYKEVELTKEQQNFINSVPIGYFYNSDNLIINDGKIVGYLQLQNIADTFIHQN